MERYIELMAQSHNVWFCVNILSKQERKKEYCRPTNLVWADLDTCEPSTVDPPPSVIIQTSPSRWQAIWRMEIEVAPEIASNYSKRIAYAYSQDGADPSGWDLTQLLRVPLTYNFKYPNKELKTVPKVELEQALELLVPAALFEALPVVVIEDDTADDDVPTELPEVEAVIYKYHTSLKNTKFNTLFTQDLEIDDDWSRSLWHLINICIEAGMSRTETFAIAAASKCNKYARDNRPIRYLWREVVKADESQTKLNVITANFQPIRLPELITEEEINKLQPTFIDQYKNWAVEATDAVPQFHELSAFISLSGISASGLKLETSYGEQIPNLWGLILGDSTLTRKTTAMRMVIDLLTEIDDEVILATDGSAEGLLTGLGDRPHRISLFYKDEIAGFFESMNKKDYLAGMKETLTQLYDVPNFYTRRLRKEVIAIRRPIFIFFGGGIKDKTYELIDEQYILSGFLPRFLIVSGNTDISRIRRTGPGNTKSSTGREAIKSHLADMRELYQRQKGVTIAGQDVFAPDITDVVLNPKAWDRYGDIEMLMANTASESAFAPVALPTFERLSRSLLKMATLLAAARQEPKKGKITVEPRDINTAAYYIQRWMPYTLDLLQNSGKGATERLLGRIIKTIQREPGITRGRIMQHHHLTKRMADEVLGTLDDRGQIKLVRAGRGTRLWVL